MKFSLRLVVLSTAVLSVFSTVAPTLVRADSREQLEAAIEKSHFEIAKALMAKAEPGSTVQIIGRLARLNPALVRAYFHFDLSEQTKSDLVLLAQSQLEMKKQIEHENPLHLLNASQTGDEQTRAIADHARAAYASNRVQLKEIESNLKLLDEVLNGVHNDLGTGRLSNEIVQRLRAIEFVQVIQVKDRNTLPAILKLVAAIDFSENQAVAGVRILPAPKQQRVSGPIMMDVQTNNPRLRFSLEIPKVCKDAF